MLPLEAYAKNLLTTPAYQDTIKLIQSKFTGDVVAGAQVNVGRLDVTMGRDHNLIALRGNVSVVEKGKPAQNFTASVARSLATGQSFGEISLVPRRGGVVRATYEMSMKAITKITGWA